MTTLTVECEVHFARERKGRKTLATGPKPPGPAAPGRVPRVARLLALAIRFDHLIRTGQVASYAEVARLGHVTRARVCQVMNLLHLAPDIQEAVLFLPRTERGRDALQLRHLLGVAAAQYWSTQRRIWDDLHRRFLA